MRDLASAALLRGRGDRSAKRGHGVGWFDEAAARIMMQAYDWQGAMETSQRMLRTDPDHLGALEVLAQAQWFGGQFDAVISTTSRLLRLNPLEPGYRYTRGMAHLSKGELSLAYDDFRTAISQSDNADFQEQVAFSLHALERWMVESPARHSRFGAPLSSPFGRLN